jgi:hypothetical protein
MRSFLARVTQKRRAVVKELNVVYEVIGERGTDGVISYMTKALVGPPLAWISRLSQGESMAA